METRQYRGRELRYVTVYPDGYDEKKRYPMLIMLHGFGSHMHDLAPLGQMLHPSGYLYVCPNGPLELPISPWQLGYAWTPPRDAATPELVQGVEGVLGRFFDEVSERYRVEPSKAVLLGFSQGGAMAFRCGLPQPERFAGVAALCSTVPNEAELRAKLPAKRTQPVFVAYGEHDQMIAPERAHAAKRFLEEAGYPLRFKGYRMGHEITPEVLADLQTWLAEVLPPAA